MLQSITDCWTTAMEPDRAKASQAVSKCFGVRASGSQNQGKWRGWRENFFLPTPAPDDTKKPLFFLLKGSRWKVTHRTAVPRNWWEVNYDFNEIVRLAVSCLSRARAPHLLSQFQCIRFLSSLVSFCSIPASNCRTKSLQSSDNRVTIINPEVSNIIITQRTALALSYLHVPWVIFRRSKITTHWSVERF